MDWNRTLRNGIFYLRFVILMISIFSFGSAISYVLKYSATSYLWAYDEGVTEIYIKGVPFRAVLNSMIVGGLFAVLERTIKIVEDYFQPRFLKKKSAVSRFVFE